MADIMCRQSASYSHDADPKGNCRWCGQRITSPARKPVRYNERSELELAYGYYYDPDFEWPNSA